MDEAYEAMRKIEEFQRRNPGKRVRMGEKGPELAPDCDSLERDLAALRERVDAMERRLRVQVG